VRRNELTIVAVLVAVAIAVGFWILILGPKRQEASDLSSDVDQLHSQVLDAQAAAAAGEEARKSFSSDYHQLVVLGKAVPVDGDQASMLVQLQSLADRSGISFDSLDLTDVESSSTSAAATAAPSTSSTSSDSSTAGTTPAPTDTSSTDTSVTSGVATEASAAALPIGASVGPAGLPVMGYELTFSGGFFQISDFLRRVDSMVRAKHGSVVVDGRLVTVDAFSLSPITESGKSVRKPVLTADLTVTTYLTPADQGVTAGASPGSPAPTVPGATPTPASTTGTATSSTSTATPTPAPTP
jgi:Tfp pilus assembly protein PilO